jgi:hypothetical protein
MLGNRSSPSDRCPEEHIVYLAAGVRLPTHSSAEQIRNRRTQGGKLRTPDGLGLLKSIEGSVPWFLRLMPKEQRHEAGQERDEP